MAAASQGKKLSHQSGKKRIVFLGPPNSGKGTQAGTLAQRLGIPAISTGEMLRAAVGSGTELGERVKDIMESGQLVDDDTMADVIRARLSEDDAAGGFLLDGYPRTAAQVETLRRILVERGDTLDDVVLIDAPDQVLSERARKRLELDGRKDDHEEIVRERLEVYRRQTAPLIEIYDSEGLLRRIDGDQAIDEVGRLVAAAIGES